MKYCKTPCDECPWRKDMPVGRFPADNYRQLANTAQDLALHTFACHKSAEGQEAICAGYILKQSAHNLAMRMARHSFEASSPYPLYENFRELAIANGVDSNDLALLECRDDGQMFKA